MEKLAPLRSAPRHVALSLRSGQITAAANGVVNLLTELNVTNNIRIPFPATWVRDWVRFEYGNTRFDVIYCPSREYYLGYFG